MKQAEVEGKIINRKETRTKKQDGNELNGIANKQVDEKAQSSDDKESQTEKGQGKESINNTIKIFLEELEKYSNDQNDKENVFKSYFHVNK